ncbi:MULTISPECIES: hypothetical protein [unclassified Microbacterium]|uniref:hypothetical protein n=1 Tax=unclassified Microbacterium TaxID=2609290 RepID=UPI0012F9CB47|nr:hypothetical protein [Microbacterium sp. MAH-37]MVQ41425.1 hypothetical protein [Microbacterium sp. MAH-37]
MHWGRVGTAPLRAWALVVGYVGAASALALLLFFALADPFGVNLRTWSWLGPANDALSIVMAPGQAVAMVLLWQAMRPAPVVAVLTWLTIAALFAGAVVTAMMLAGLATLDTQYVFAIPMIVLMFAALLAAGLRVLRDRAHQTAIAPGAARWAVITGASGIVALLIFALGFLFPAGSAVQLVVFIVGGIPGAIAYLGYPVWWLVLGLRRDAVIYLRSQMT